MTSNYTQRIKIGKVQFINGRAEKKLSKKYTKNKLN